MQFYNDIIDILYFSGCPYENECMPFDSVKKNMVTCKIANCTEKGNGYRLTNAANGNLSPDIMIIFNYPGTILNDVPWVLIRISFMYYKHICFMIFDWSTF